MIYPQGSILYITQAGDTLGGLASRFGITIEALARANPFVQACQLEPGQIVSLPMGGSFPVCPGGYMYHAKPGDTFYTVAKAHGVTLDELANANPGINPDYFTIGQQICIPLHTMPASSTAGGGSQPNSNSSIPPNSPAQSNSNPHPGSISSPQSGSKPGSTSQPNTPLPSSHSSIYPTSTATSNSSVQPFSPSHSNAQANATATMNPNVHVNVNLSTPVCSHADASEVIAVSSDGVEKQMWMTYLVKPGENIQLIARKFHTTVAALRRANPGVFIECLHVGQKIFVENHWSQYTNHPCKISFFHPSTWRCVGSDRYEGADGFFHVTMLVGGSATLEDICWSEAYARNRPYGSQPSVQREFIQGCDARIILPSVDQPITMNEQAALVLRAPTLTVIGEQVYNYILILASKNYVHEIAHTLEFRVHS